MKLPHREAFDLGNLPGAWLAARSDRDCKPITATGRPAIQGSGSHWRKEVGFMPATAPHHPKGWYDLMITVVRCIAALAGEWMQRGGHF